ncbi:hypothetical protein ACA612_15695 [Lactiplantibacillus plantarum]
MYSETVTKTTFGTEVGKMNGYDSWLVDQEEAAEGWRDDAPTKEDLIESGVIADD